MTRLVSIVGMSRSGSTLLGLLLGGHRGVLYLGETMNFGSAWAHPNARCSCREILSQCEFWQRVVTRAGLNEVPAEISAEVGRRLIDAAAELADAHTVVDSSKHPGWQRALSTAIGDDAIAVHLVRDPRGHLASAHIGWSADRAPAGPPPFGLALRVAGAWVKRNWWSLATSRRWLRRSRIRYEDIVAGGDLGVPASWIGAADVAWIGTAHVPTGNPVARRPGGGEVRADTRWVERVPAWMQLVVWLLTFPLVASYGYAPIARGRTSEP